jgi:hypothetical protein
MFSYPPLLRTGFGEKHIAQKKMGDKGKKKKRIITLMRHAEAFSYETYG